MIISTYNNPQWLQKSLWGYMLQTLPPDEIIIADDGSDTSTRQMVETFSGHFHIKYVWQADEGFQKSKILNKALLVADAQYLIFTDQDCIPQKDFVETHIRNAKKGSFLSGGYVRLTDAVSHRIERDNIVAQQPFSISWLRSVGQPASFKLSKLLKCRCLKWLLNTFTTARSSWNGCNASGWKSDLLEVNGFNELMHYGGQDREFGERLVNNGIRGRQVRYFAIVVHLEHERTYKTEDSIAYNLRVREATRRNKVIRTPNGINKL